MPGIQVILDGDGSMPDLADRMDDVIHLTGSEISFHALKTGMTSGKSSVAIRVNLPDGKVVVAETSMRLFLEAAKLIGTAKTEFD